MTVIPANVTIYTRHATGTVIAIIVNNDEIHRITTTTADFDLLLHCSCGKAWRPGYNPPPCEHLRAFTHRVCDVRQTAVAA